MTTTTATTKRLSRRGFLARTGVATGVAATGPFLAPRFAMATPDNPATGDAVVFVFLRGGADGLSLVAPHRMSSYRTMRPTLRVRSPEEFADPTGRAGLPLTAGGNVAPFDLHDVFALNPSFASLYNTAWAAGQMAVVHAAGLPSSVTDTRSHFDAQRFWETGGNTALVGTGFLNRYLQAIGATTGLAGLGQGTALPLSLSGPNPSFSVDDPSAFSVSGFGDNALAESILRDWYTPRPGDRFLSTGATTLSLMSQVRAVDWTSPTVTTRPGTTYPGNPFARGLQQIARVLRAGVGARVAAIDLGNWDMHAGHGTPEDPGSWIRRQTALLSDSLAAFVTDLGPAINETTIVVVSEFGRTLNENGTGGLDHGRGGAMLLIGGGIRGGVHGRFNDTVRHGPDGDLEVLNDWRTVMAEVLTVRAGLPSGALGEVLPGWSGTPIGVCRT